MALKSGDVLAGKLTLVEKIGAGAMGAVWLAEDGELDRRVAVKMITRALDKQAVARFRREASLAAKIRSPHVVEIYGHGVSDDGEPYIEMELLEGESLAARMKSGALPLEQVLEIVTQVGRALTASHALGVVHRDIKPGNVQLVDVPGYDVFVKVVDFGIAKQRSDEAGELTATGAIVGTPYYMSPEQLTSTKDVDHRADLWALAVMTYQMLTGSVPFRGDTIGAVSVAVSKGEFAPVSSELVAAGGEVDAWFARAFANDIDERFESAQELTRTFVEVCETTAEAPTIEGSSSFDTAPAALEPSPASTADPATATARAEAKTEPSAGGSKRWLVGVAIAGLATWWFVTGDPQVDSSGPVASAMVSATASANATTTSRAPHHASRKRKGGRLPPNHIQTMVRRNFDALSSCLDTEKALRRAMVRTLRFVIQEDGTTADVHVGEMDPSTPSLDACLVAKIQAMGFSPPEGGVVTVSYPIVFSNDDWQPLDRAACRMTPDCRGNGRCGVSKESCAVTEDEDCTLSRLCVQRGQCHADGGRCVAGAEGGPDSLPCERFGLCAVAEGQARAGSDEHCKKSKACGAHGICSADHGVCVAANDDDCNKSAYCRIAGRCVSDGGWCVAAGDSCERSEGCRYHGRCSLRFGECAALSDDDCRKSAACMEQGQCGVRGGMCVAVSEADCKKSAQCKERAQCVLVGNSCTMAD